MNTDKPTTDNYTGPCWVKMNGKYTKAETFFIGEKRVFKVDDYGSPHPLASDMSDEEKEAQYKAGFFTATWPYKIAGITEWYPNPPVPREAWWTKLTIKGIFSDSTGYSGTIGIVVVVLSATLLCSAAVTLISAIRLLFH